MIEVINGKKYILIQHFDTSAPCGSCVFLNRNTLHCNYPGENKQCKMLPGTLKGWNTSEYELFNETIHNKVEKGTDKMEQKQFYTNFLTAKNARELTDANKNTMVTEQLNVIHECIKESINKGKYCTQIDISKIPHYDLTKLKLHEKLKDLGYIVLFQTSQKDGDYLEVKW